MTDEQFREYTEALMKESNCHCCSTNPPRIDLTKPIKYTDWPSEGATVKVLMESYQNANGLKGALIVCQAKGKQEQALFILDTATGIGTNARLLDVRVNFENAPVVIEDVSYINYYHNDASSVVDNHQSVAEAFPTRVEADGENLFNTRDCCIKLTVTSTNGVWTANAIVL